MYSTRPQIRAPRNNLSDTQAISWNVVDDELSATQLPATSDPPWSPGLRPPARLRVLCLEPDAHQHVRVPGEGEVEYCHEEADTRTAT